MMKKILYYLPAIVFGLVYCLLLIEGQGPVLWHGWLFLVMMIISGILFSKGKWWGTIPGVALGIYFIYSGMTNEYAILPEWQVGIILILYYIGCSVFAAPKKK